VILRALGGLTPNLKAVEIKCFSPLRAVYALRRSGDLRRFFRAGVSISMMARCRTEVRNRSACGIRWARIRFLGCHRRESAWPRAFSAAPSGPTAANRSNMDQNLGMPLPSTVARTTSCIRSGDAILRILIRRWTWRLIGREGLMWRRRCGRRRVWSSRSIKSRGMRAMEGQE
jgi:hypothetical protein